MCLVLKSINFLLWRAYQLATTEEKDEHLLSNCKEIMSQHQAMCIQTMNMQLQDVTEEAFPGKERKKQQYYSWNAKNTKWRLQTHHLDLIIPTDENTIQTQKGTEDGY